MELPPLVAQVQDQLAAAAALGDERTQQIAKALATAAAPAVRLAVLEAVTSAAEEITSALLDHPGSPVVSVRLDGDEVVVDVHAADPGAIGDDAPRDDGGEPNARISLRLTEALKADIDAAAARDAVSVNAWLTRAAAAALRSPWGSAGFGTPFGPGSGAGAAGRGRGRRDNQHRITGWING
jgi:hypothetical protein